MAGVFVSAVNENGLNAGSFACTTGNLLLIAAEGNSIPATAISDTQGNTYTQIFKGLTFSVWYAVAKSSAANTVTGTMSSTNSAITMMQYSGFNTPVIDDTAVQELPAKEGAVACGALALHYQQESVMTFFLTFQQATTYTPTSGSTSRTFSNSFRMQGVDKLNQIVQSYTETGTISGTATPMQFGGEVISVAIAASGISPYTGAGANLLEYGFGF